MKIIAECCQNHDGDTAELLRMVNSAARGGATHIKTQCIHTDELTFRPQFEIGLVSDNLTLCIKRPYKQELERLKPLELTADDHKSFIEYSLELGLTPMTTVFARSSIDFAFDCGYRSIKVASYDCGSFPMISTLCQMFDEIIISTGASYDSEINQAASIVRNANKEVCLLHCVTMYPTPPEEANLNRLSVLKKYADSVGYSDHSDISLSGLETTLSAIYLGAEVVERHFTVLDRNQTKDGPVSITESELAEVSGFSKLSNPERLTYLEQNYPSWRRCLGKGDRALSHQELLNRDYYRGRFASPRSKSLASDDTSELHASDWIYNYEADQ